MRFARLCAFGLVALPVLALAQTPAPAPPNVEVQFLKPEKFTDATYDNRSSSREQVGKDLAAYLGELGKRYLPPGQKLQIDVTDIDLAGRYEPWTTPASDVRFMRDITWPRIALKYRLLEGDQEIAHGDEQVSDKNYLGRIGLGNSSDRLRYEKAMLVEWFRSRFDPTVKKPAAL